MTSRYTNILIIYLSGDIFPMYSLDQESLNSFLGYLLKPTINLVCYYIRAVTLPRER